MQQRDNSTEEPDPVLDRHAVLMVDVSGFEGPLDLLLEMSRRQKVDLAQISIAGLAEQYLQFVDQLRDRRIEIAADYLVMAAWLAYLKSRLMVPQAPADEEPSGEAMAALLQFRLKRLESMRAAAATLAKRARLGREIFARGSPEPVESRRIALWEVTLVDLLKAYASHRDRTAPADYKPAQRQVWSLQHARDILSRLLGSGADWVALDSFLARYLASPADRSTVLASSLSASLEMVRQGEVEMRQSLAFGPLLMRRRRGETA